MLHTGQMQNTTVYNISVVAGPLNGFIFSCKLLHACMHMNMYTHTHTHTHTHACTHVSTQTHTCTHTHVGCEDDPSLSPEKMCASSVKSRIRSRTEVSQRL